ncbi:MULTISPECIES: isoleucine--tRNA ligase [unclassified Variovorax]|uniref:isoleucine--tRNA ligase n=1 Tax=unclassified Variovorax TaxID=663243 RepID=UPI0013184D4D|nr:MULTISPECIES: class I tRNA ligase family protein [unclassified Variovorax]VTU42909.1 Isoleucine--tRNA ligase [Variovorax sp. SRS16]VTU42940.1 Isoleucine--tRNA ligase [Variovorax sp. PBL-E5]VTU43592.1 Isoleucine--tRNA ligase [Variovorax sp. PBL-H6]
MYHLNLFKSSFELPQLHADKAPYLALWGAPATVDALHRNPVGKPLFLLHDGPPYANGGLHLGHFVNKTLKDALVKFKRLDGYFAPFVPGFDCHGLPVELEVEKLGVSKDDPRAFVEACRAYAEGQVANQTAEFRTFGVAADWEQPYRTLDPEFEAGAARLFSELPNVAKRLRPVHWCPDCASPLAEAEVEYKERASDSLVVLFPVEGLENTFLQVWTTTPYTLPANKGVAYSPALDYVAVADGARTLVRARAPEDAADTPTFDLAGRRAYSPYTGELVPLLPADYVTSSGTGLVHLAPAFGMDDFRVGEAHGLAVEHYVDERGRFLHGEMAGMSLREGTAHVLERVAPLVFSHENVQHEYPHCWRHKRPVFFRASSEFFMELADVGPRALDALQHVHFVPEGSRERLSSMLRSRTSWCLSRSRLWGTPLVDASDPEDRALAARVAGEGVEAWHSAGPRRTLDVWFDSGATHELVMKKRFGRTADVYLEGTDQHRGWFQSSLLTAVAAGGPAPYKALLTHGMVVDEHGRKYSKSSKNYLPLDELFKRYSPDVLRLWALQQDFTKELKLSPKSLDQTVERYRKVRNTLRFCLQNLVDFDFDFALAELTHSQNRLQVLELRELVTGVQEAAGLYDFAAATALLLKYADAVSSDYFTAVKDALYCEAAGSERRREVQYVLACVLNTLLRLLAPVLPFTAEEVFQSVRDALRREEASVLLLTLGDLALPSVDTPDELLATYDQLKALKREVNQYVDAHRQDGLKSASSLELAVVVPDTPAALLVSEAEMVDFFGCAEVRLGRGNGYGVRVVSSERGLCPRCRRHSRTGLFLDLCARCDDVEGTAAALGAAAA